MANLSRSHRVRARPPWVAWSASSRSKTLRQVDREHPVQARDKDTGYRCG